MLTLHIFPADYWTIGHWEAVKEIIQRMGWQMDDTPDESSGYAVNLPIEEAPMFFIIQDGTHAIPKAEK